ncbi:transglutaminase family protein [Pseudomarimonas salicorniae]|uniref:Transglutaminase family protein n=1 Tax=Pseudomarimonas salicorniae TaxID=2933270 RepID=A0ABT0GH95_9GAMM|nr:transglutaminase family protein [Lysobacter sp. CAU 1642]MCK7593916.1 transglutaminase family protein [Lysobacter sp. CAU 1642]
MRLSIRHTTTYRYEHPARRIVQAMRLWPAPCEHQQVADWQVRVGGRLLKPRSTDGFGNAEATLGLEGPVEELVVSVQGQVVTGDTHGVVRGTREPLPPMYFLTTSPLTEPGEQVGALLGSLPADRGEGVAAAHALMSAVRDRIAFQTEETHAETTAEEALAHGRGVCQDHAHAMIAVARQSGVPARFVSGYLWTDSESESPASHAWCELFLGALGWVGFDPANGVCPTDAYVRIAVGRDGRDAAPIRGLREGGAVESLEVTVRVAQALQQTQSQQQ